jgi:hypothetical protein
VHYRGTFVGIHDSGICRRPEGRRLLAGNAGEIGSGEWTSVIGVMAGTFTKPMPIGDGKFIQPTGKKFSINMCTVGHWKDGVMIEEWLFWDSATYMKQMGIGQ